MRSRAPGHGIADGGVAGRRGEQKKRSTWAKRLSVNTSGQAASEWNENVVMFGFGVESIVADGR